ncbi:hypothetical protein EZV73_13880 [Acidaminobacter sp. JC074]|uniref:hypothetical protein n=1 Tax=Acidaminobacter sp. JC074 TaxID=2530199 RepID=UPI001F106BD0|nr:hypothetical protein [Acidaminobacter sp. JC074]MCH4888678.1 hypothetical protein [Acidaminobacter sp. JC074]
MKKKVILLLMMSLVLLTFAACSNDEAANDLPLNKELMKLMPNEGFRWAYRGAAEYYHEMDLKSITEDEKEIIYKVEGEVEDVVSGEQATDYTISLFYKIMGDSVIQTKTAPMMLDSEYDELTIIKAPLEKGTKWTEQVKNQEGKKVTLEGEIIQVDEDERGNIYKVTYVDKKTGYSETRKIMENFGVIAFTKLVEIDGKNFSQGYGLYGSGSGYLKSADTETDEPVDNEETDATETETDSETDTTDTDATDTGSSETGDSDTTSDTSQEDDKKDEEQAVRNALVEFNDAWIEYVNNDNQAYFDLITSNGVAYKNAKNFNRTGLTEKFLVMKINQVNVSGSYATAKVYEEIQKTKDGSTTVAKYNWIYSLKKIDGKWLIDGYTKQ